MTKIVYTYHPETKELIGKDTAYESPLEKGTFMMPANSTIKEPIFEPGKITKWVDENWVLEDIPELPLPPEPTLQEIQQALILETKAICASIIINSYPEYKQMNLLAKVASIQNKEIVALKTGSVYQLSKEDMMYLGQAQRCESFIASVRAKSNELEQKILVMTQESLKTFDPKNDNNWR